MGMGSHLLQGKNPIDQIDAYVCGLHFYNGDIGRQVIAHHFCSHRSEEFLQCVIYDTNPGFAVSNQKRESERFLALDTRDLHKRSSLRGVWDNLPSFQPVLDYGILGGKVNLKRHVVRKNGKQHVYYSLSETILINRNRTSATPSVKSRRT